MTTKFFDKLLAAGFDVQTQNQGTTVTVSYTQVGPSFDSNLKEIENQFKLFNGGNNPIDWNADDFYSGVTSVIKEMHANPDLAKIVHDQAHEGAIASDCGNVVTLIRAGVAANYAFPIGPWHWYISGGDNSYRLTINPDCAISIEAMREVCGFIEAQLGSEWVVVLVNRTRGIEIVKPDYSVTYFTNLINASRQDETLRFTLFGMGWRLHQEAGAYMFQPTQSFALELGVLEAGYAAILRELGPGGQYQINLVDGPSIAVVKKEGIK